MLSTDCLLPLWQSASVSGVTLRIERKTNVMSAYSVQPFPGIPVGIEEQEF